MFEGKHGECGTPAVQFSRLGLAFAFSPYKRARQGKTAFHACSWPRRPRCSHPITGPSGDLRPPNSRTWLSDIQVAIPGPHSALPNRLRHHPTWFRLYHHIFSLAYHVRHAHTALSQRRGSSPALGTPARRPSYPRCPCTDVPKASRALLQGRGNLASRLLRRRFWKTPTEYTGCN